MQTMIDFSIAILEGIATFLETPPVFYLFGLILFCYVAKFIKILVERRH